MNRTRLTWVGACAVAIAVAILYLSRLSYAPIYLGHDEVFFALQAHAIAETGRDVQGRLLPLYFEVFPLSWFHPAAVYSMALVFTLLPISETAIRLPTACIALINIALTYLVARKLFARRSLAAAAALLLALTPAHFIHARLGMDYLYPVPFVMAWLLCLLIHLQRGQKWWLFAGSLCLGLGFYSYLASVVMMPVYLCLTLAVLATSRRDIFRLSPIAIAGFVLPLTLLLVWLIQHPTFYSDMLGRYKLYDPKLNPAQGAKEFLNYTSMTQRVYLYWEYFNPSFLFFSGGSNVMNATRRAGVFPFVFAILLPLGVYRIVAVKRAPRDVLVLLGFLVAPLAALLVDETGAIDRELGVLPFGALVATYGVEGLVEGGERWGQALAIGLVLLVPVQFNYFYRDYMSDYRLRSLFWFERNIRGAVEQVLTLAPRGQPAKVYLSAQIPFIDYHWRFYVLKYGREDLRDAAVVADLTRLDATSVNGAIVVADAADRPTIDKLTQADPARRVSDVLEPNGVASFVIVHQ